MKTDEIRQFYERLVTYTVGLGIDLAAVGFANYSASYTPGNFTFTGKPSGEIKRKKVGDIGRRGRDDIQAFVDFADDIGSEIISTSYVLGQHKMTKLSLRSDEYEAALDRFNKDKNLSGEDKRRISTHEMKVWEYAGRILDDKGFKNWQQFHNHREDSLQALHGIFESDPNN